MPSSKQTLKVETSQSGLAFIAAYKATFGVRSRCLLAPSLPMVSSSAIILGIFFEDASSGLLIIGLTVARFRHFTTVLAICGRYFCALPKRYHRPSLTVHVGVKLSLNGSENKDFLAPLLRVA